MSIRSASFQLTHFKLMLIMRKNLHYKTTARSIIIFEYKINIHGLWLD